MYGADYTSTGIYTKGKGKKVDIDNRISRDVRRATAYCDRSIVPLSRLSVPSLFRDRK